MGVVGKVGSEVKKVKKGDRVVASFQIACALSRLGIFYRSFVGKRLISQYSCGECSFCKEGLPSMCDHTNNSRLQEKL
jgi:Zn-dependent alcohol dehydrogenase